MSITSKASLFSTWDVVMGGTVRPDTLNEKGAPAYSTSGSKCLDAYVNILRDTPDQEVVRLFRDAYVEDPSLALKVLMNLRDRDGKQEKRVSFIALNFLKMYAPRTYAKNLDTFVNLGCFKDLLVLHSQKRHPMLPDLELQLFSAYLAQDVAAIASVMGTTKANLSLAGKWAPTERCEYDKKTKAAHKIAAFLGKNMKQYRLMLSTLRTRLDVLERKESLNKWTEINFEHVPAVAMKKQSKAFKRKLPTEFAEYLSKVMTGKAKMASKGVQPHELVRNYLSRYMPMDAATDAQWFALINRLKTAGLFKNAVAVCDVSGSMSGIPMEVSIALGLVVSELTEMPFKNRVITFSAKPQWHTVKGTTLHERVASLSKAHWEMNTDFIAVFEMLLAEAKMYNLMPEQMIKKVFVFTDMQFDAATNQSQYQTAYQNIQEKYTEAGYVLPQIVFWNLRSTATSFPVLKNTPGVAMVCGFSAEVLKVFLDEGEMTPYSMMLKAVSKYTATIMDEVPATVLPLPASPAESTVSTII